MNVRGHQQKTIFVVLGMPRSGTSAIARGLKALGVDLGKKCAESNQVWNPKGFWEGCTVFIFLKRFDDINSISSLLNLNPLSFIQ